ncbi:uncharacterized protein L203_103999 [Cryptococcus depauperatus CBS 7841]|uniref:SEC7 domain-containing protein n=1 Tax=Cryptococcus depauperatus CBS 7841 TaxID=1295531 RepID=A0AAJ8M2N9_9TREE
MGLRSLSPIPSRSISPAPRPSTSSSHSLKRSKADFEAVLRNPQETLFLSAGPKTIGEEPNGEAGLTPRLDSSSSGRTYLGEKGAETLLNAGESNLDRGRSFADKMENKEDGRTGLGVGQMSTAIKGLPIPSVVSSAPIMNSMNHMRNGSQMTVASTMSAGPEGTSVRATRGASQSMGIEAELDIKSKEKEPPKRRSIFRSAGTTSHPDLASIVHRLKDPKTKPEPLPSAGPMSTHLASSTSSRTLVRTSQASLNSNIQQDRFGLDPKMNRNDNMEQYESMLRGNQMATIVEGGAIGMNRNRLNTADEGFKSMRNKAKGMLGKMFGSSNQSQRSPSPSASASTSRFDIHEETQPPVPPVPSAYTNYKANAIKQSSVSSVDVFGSVNQPSYSHSKLTSGRDRDTFAVAVPDRRVSETSQLSTDKPLPAVKDADPDETPSSKKRGSMNIRQRTSTGPDTEPSTMRHTTATSPSTRAISAFSDDMADILADIGQSEPARELGIPPQNCKSRNKLEGKDEGRGSIGLGQSPSDQETGSHLVLVSPSQRSSSLPSSITSSKHDTNTLKRRSSSQMTSHLEPNIRSNVSRKSSRSSMSKHSGKSPALGAPSSPAPQISPIFHEKRRSGENVSSSLSSSVKLVPSRSETSSAPPAELNRYTTSSARGHQSPAQMSYSETIGFHSHNQEQDEMEMIASPPDTPQKGLESAEDEEEKGRRMACEFLEGQGSTVGDKIAEFLGRPHNISKIALRYYMQYFDMKGQNLVEAFRDLCQKLFLKAESQEIDRIIEAFSARYYECNPNTVFRSSGVVHTVAAAMLMLNTDLHIADLPKHMSRTDFVKNAMRAIHESMTPNELTRDGASTPDLIRDDSSSAKPSFGSTSSMSTTYISMRAKTPTQIAPGATPRSASAPVVSSPQPHHRTDSVLSMSTNTTVERHRSSSTTGNTPSIKNWEVEAEAALKDIYSAVKSDRILLPIPGLGTNDRNFARHNNNRQSMISVSSIGHDARSGRVRSPSDRVSALKRGSIRGMQGLLNNPYGTGNWSVSEGRLSPAPNYVTSIKEASSSSFAPLGFASNLSHTVIKENEDEVGSIRSRTSVGTIEDMDDDELALLGAPWAKEGILQRKNQSESVAKRVKKGDWKQFFVVVSKGDLYMFTFGDGKNDGFMGGAAVGGGNWLENANANGTVSLLHTVAATIPKPGYGSSRPYCFSLTQPSGEVCVFQAGTEDLVAEWVATCNYWAARKSRQPLPGGVSNMEYGWNKAGHHSSDDQDDRLSVMSHSSRIARFGGTYGRRAFAGMMSGQYDKIFINDWNPPQPTMIPSSLEEEAQLESLISYVKSQEKELERHKAFEEPMMRLYTHGSKNYSKAKDNWRIKSHYIHTEIYKYETYIDALKNAISLRVKKQGEKKLEKSLNTSLNSLHAISSGDPGYDEEEDGNEAFNKLEAKKLTIDTIAAGQFDDEEEDQPATPQVTIRGR